MLVEWPKSLKRRFYGERDRTALSLVNSHPRQVVATLVKALYDNYLLGGFEQAAN